MNWRSKLNNDVCSLSKNGVSLESEREKILQCLEHRHSVRCLPLLECLRKVAPTNIVVNIYVSWCVFSLSREGKRGTRERTPTTKIDCFIKRKKYIFLKEQAQSILYRLERRATYVIETESICRFAFFISYWSNNFRNRFWLTEISQTRLVFFQQLFVPDSTFGTQSKKINNKSFISTISEPCSKRPLNY